jgi:hypothetical protein
MANLLTTEGSSEKSNQVQRNLSAPQGKLAKWRTAALKAKELPDPWEGYHFDDIPEERVTRYMYNPRSGKWKTDEIVVKMQSQVFVSPHIVGIPEILINSHQASESAYNQTYYAMPSSL